MATKFLEPGGDATFDTSLWSNPGSATIVSDIVHGGHLRSIKYSPNSGNTMGQAAVLAGAGGRISFYVYLVALPAATSKLCFLKQTGFGGNVAVIQVTNTGVLQLAENTSQIGSNGPTLATGQWYRISLAFTVTSTVVNRFEAFVGGVSAISVTNAVLTNASPADFRMGTLTGFDTLLEFRSSDHYIDDSNALTDPGNIWVTAKRPNANGTTNGFTTQIGSGGSGYGSGHSPQVNERPLSVTNGWSMIGAGSAVTEEYNIENKSTGDIDISTATIVDFMGWVYAKAALSETASIVVAGASSNISLTSSNTMFTKFAGSSTYPPGSGADIGIITATTVTTVSLYEGGIVVAYIPAPGPDTPSVSDSITVSDVPTIVSLNLVVPASRNSVKIIG